MDNTDLRPIPTTQSVDQSFCPGELVTFEEREFKGEAVWVW